MGGGGGTQRGRGAVYRCSVAILFTLLLDRENAGVVWAVIIARQKVAILCAETGVVGLAAGVDLTLDRCLAGLENTAAV